MVGAIAGWPCLALLQARSCYLGLCFLRRMVLYCSFTLFLCVQWHHSPGNSAAAGERSSQNRRNTRQQQSRAVEDDSVARGVGNLLGAVGVAALLAYESSKSTLILFGKFAQFDTCLCARSFRVSFYISFLAAIPSWVSCKIIPGSESAAPPDTRSSPAQTGQAAQSFSVIRVVPR